MINSNYNILSSSNIFGLFVGMTSPSEANGAICTKPSALLVSRKICI